MNYKQLCRINDDYNVNAPGYGYSDTSSSGDYPQQGSTSKAEAPANEEKPQQKKTEGRNLTDESQFSHVVSNHTYRYHLKCTFYKNGTMVEDTNYWCIDNSQWGAYKHTLQNVQDDMRDGTFADPSWDYEIVITNIILEDDGGGQDDGSVEDEPATEAQSTEVDDNTITKADVIDWLDTIGLIIDSPNDADPLVLDFYSEAYGDVPDPRSYIFSLDFNVLTQQGGWEDAVVELGEKIRRSYHREGMPSALHKHPDYFRVSLDEYTYFRFVSKFNKYFNFVVDIAKLDDSIFNEIIKTDQ